MKQKLRILPTSRTGLKNLWKYNFSMKLQCVVNNFVFYKNITRGGGGLVNKLLEVVVVVVVKSTYIALL